MRFNLPPIGWRSMGGLRSELTILSRCWRKRRPVRGRNACCDSIFRCRKRPDAWEELTRLSALVTQGRALEALSLCHFRRNELDPKMPQAMVDVGDLQSLRRHRAMRILVEAAALRLEPSCRLKKSL